ncbi:MAG: 16S rRNA (uracil(1498)-N(3))-methyltransferase [Bacteroidales bacterium]|nr:16S rRNA (uracil(1498)-N(3))-methyltransferase [Bacteroidales bacterium]
MKENSHIFYCPQAINAVEGQIVNLDEEESAHCCKVLRLNVNDQISLIDGVGGMYSAILVMCTKNSCSAKILQLENDIYIRPYYNHIAISPTKNIDRFEWFIEKAVEFGVDMITPILCSHSERKILKIERLEKIILSAVKQSGNVILPKINQLTPVLDVIKNANEDLKFIAHCEPGEKQFFANVCLPKSKSITLIGPEGDFSDQEINDAINKYGFKPISLGNTRLRTETAGVSISAFLACINN